MSTLTDINKSSNIAVSLIDTLKAFGLYEKFCENPSSILTEVDKVVSKQLKLVEDELKTVLASFDFSTILLILGSMLASVVIGAAVTVIDQVSNFIANTVGSIVSVFSAIISMPQGAIVFFRYQAARQLQQNLEHRIQLLDILYDDINKIVLTIDRYLALFSKNEVSDKFFEIDRALNYIKMAIRLISVEVNKSNSSHYVINPKTVEDTDRFIKMAMEELSLDSSKVSTEFFDNLSKKYNLKTKQPKISINFLKDWADYISTLLEEAEASLTHENVMNLLYELFPVIPEFIRIMLMQAQVRSSIKTINFKSPTLLGNLTSDAYDKVTKYSISGLIFSIYDGILNRGLSKAEIKVPAFFTNDDTKDMTLQSLDNSIVLYKTLLLTFKTSWNFIKLAAAPFEKMINTALDDLIKIKKDIELTRKNTPDDISALIGKKTDWIIQLEGVRTYLKPTINKGSGILLPGISDNINALNGMDLSYFLQEEGLLFDTLQQDIAKSMKNTSAKKAIILANKVMPILIESSYTSIIAKSNFGKDLYAELKSIEFLYYDQLLSDRVEYSNVSSYISNVESFEVFQIISDAMTSILNSLGVIPSLNSAVDSLLNGDLSKVINMTGNSINVLEDIAACAGEDIDILGEIQDWVSGGVPDASTIHINKINDKLTKIKTKINNLSTYAGNITKKMDDVKDLLEKAKNENDALEEAKTGNSQINKLTNVSSYIP